MEREKFKQLKSNIKIKKDNLEKKRYDYFLAQTLLIGSLIFLNLPYLKILAYIFLEPSFYQKLHINPTLIVILQTIWFVVSLLMIFALILETKNVEIINEEDMQYFDGFEKEPLRGIINAAIVASLTSVMVRVILFYINDMLLTLKRGIHSEISVSLIIFGLIIVSFLAFAIGLSRLYNKFAEVANTKNYHYDVARVKYAMALLGFDSDTLDFSELSLSKLLDMFPVMREDSSSVQIKAFKEYESDSYYEQLLGYLRFSGDFDEWKKFDIDDNELSLDVDTPLFKMMSDSDLLRDGATIMISLKNGILRTTSYDWRRIIFDVNEDKVQIKIEDCYGGRTMMLATLNEILEK